MRPSLSAIAATVGFLFVAPAEAYIGLARWFDKPVGTQLLCGGEVYTHSKKIIALFPDTFTGYGLCGRWVKITDLRNARVDYGQVLDQVYTGNEYDLHLSYAFYSVFDSPQSTPSFNITWEYMPVGWNP